MVWLCNCIYCSNLFGRRDCDKECLIFDELPLSRCILFYCATQKQEKSIFSILVTIPVGRHMYKPFVLSQCFKYIGIIFRCNIGFYWVLMIYYMYLCVLHWMYTLKSWRRIPLIRSSLEEAAKIWKYMYLSPDICKCLGGRITGGMLQTVHWMKSALPAADNYRLCSGAVLPVSYWRK